MSTRSDIEQAVRHLSDAEYALFRAWFADYDSWRGPAATAPRRPLVPGLHPGNILYMAPDFDAEMPFPCDCHMGRDEAHS